MNDINVAINLLKVAVCPNCDGSGGVQVRTSYRQEVTKEMAMDACCPEMEGFLYSDDEWELEQCQWCDEKNQLLKSYEGKENIGEEKEYLKWFRINADFGPGHGGEMQRLHELFKKETGQKIPACWDDE